MLKKLRTTLGLSLVLSLATLPLTAQQNALDFDNVDDVVTVTNASAVIANSTNISMTLWVYPENANVTFPDYDGFAGFRNNADADFYIIQHINGGIEARFRNSAGTAYDIVVSNLALNTWQQYILTYNGTALTLYRNGTQVGTTPASGTISSSAEEFYIGNLLFGTTNFWMNGKLDEVSIWNKALTAQEVTCIYNNHIDPSDPNLKLYYKFNQGITNGNNNTINSLNNTVTGYSGTLAGFAKTGTSSNFVPGIVKGTVDSVTICPGETYSFGTLNITTAGNYIQAFPTASICDSLVELKVNLSSLNTSVQQNTTTLTSAQAGGTYQWIDCSNNSPISNAIQQAYSPLANGSYAVIVTAGNCTDTSNCILFNTIGINEYNTIEGSVFPNPFRNSTTIEFGNIQHNVTVSVMDISGRIIYNESFESLKEKTIETENWNSGTYFFEIKSDEGVLKKKLIRD